jgi:hypothetical protein
MPYGCPLPLIDGVILSGTAGVEVPPVPLVTGVPIANGAVAILPADLLGLDVFGVVAAVLWKYCMITPFTSDICTCLPNVDNTVAANSGITSDGSISGTVRYV